MQGLVVHDAEGTRWPDTMRYTEVEGHADGVLRREVEAFVRACLEGGPSPVPLTDALAAVRAADAIARSATSGEPVDLTGSPA